MNRNQVIRKGVLNSRGVDVITTEKVSGNKQHGTTPDAVLKMVEKNMIAPVLQEETKTSSGSFYSSGYKIDYKEFQAETIKLSCRRNYTGQRFRQ